MNNKWLIPINEKDIVLEVSMDGNPVAHQRPRFTSKGGVYTPKETVVYKKALTLIIKSNLKVIGINPKYRYGIQCLFYRDSRQRIDIDNLLKTALDASTNAGVWKDDSQVLEIAGRLFTAQKNPRIEIIIYLLKDDLHKSYRY